MTSGLERPTLCQLSYVRDRFNYRRVRVEPAHFVYTAKRVANFWPVISLQAATNRPDLPASGPVRFLSY